MQNYKTDLKVQESGEETGEWLQRTKENVLFIYSK